MTVRSEPLESAPTTTRKPTAIVSGSALRRVRTPFEMLIGVMLLIGSVLGNILAFNSGRFWPITLMAIGAGLGIQALLTLVQWIYSPHRGLRDLTWQYTVAVVIGAGLSVFGYSTVLYAPAFNLLSGIDKLHFMWNGYSGVQLATWVLIGVVSLVIEIIPENILVD